MKKYFEENKRIFGLVGMLVILSGPFFSIVISLISKFLNFELGDWLGFYGSMLGVVISVIIVHFQISSERDKEKERFRPEFIVAYDYQMIKPGSKIYFDGKKWFGLERKRLKQQKFVEPNSFEKQYDSSHRMDKALSIEVLNNQPVFNLCIQFFEGSYERIARLTSDEKIFVISKEHLKAHQENWYKGQKNYNHIPSRLVLFYTTLVGEMTKDVYTIDSDGNCILDTRELSDYNEIAIKSTTYDYFLKTK